MTSKGMRPVATFDEILLELGDPGTYRILVFAGLLGSVFPVFLTCMNFLFVGYVPEHRCKIPINGSWTENQSFPQIEVIGRFELDQCSMWVMDEATSIPELSGCVDGFEFDLQPQEWFIANEFELVCDRRYLLSLGLTLLYAGVMLGNLVFGSVADHLGRKKCLIIASTLQTLLGIALIFSKDAIYFFTCAFFQGIATQGMLIVAYAASSELFPPRRRTFQGIMMNCPWPLSLVILAFLYWQLGNWKYIQIIISSISAIVFLYSWFLPESIRWLLVKGRSDEAYEVIEKFARFNGITLRSSIQKELYVLASNMAPVVQQPITTDNFVTSMINSSTIRNYSFILGFASFTTMLTFLSVAFTIPSLGSNLYISYIVTGAFEFLASIGSFFIFQWFGRRRPLIFCFIVGGSVSLCGAMIKYWVVGGESTSEVISVICAIIGVMLMTVAMGGLILCMTEIYPTSMRSSGLSFCGTIGRIGSMVSPQIILLNTLWKPLPLVICAVLGFFASVFVAMLPETHQKTLPDSVLEVKQLRKNDFRKSVSG